MTTGLTERSLLKQRLHVACSQIKLQLLTQPECGCDCRGSGHGYPTRVIHDVKLSLQQITLHSRTPEAVCTVVLMPQKQKLLGLHPFLCIKNARVPSINTTWNCFIWGPGQIPQSRSCREHRVHDLHPLTAYRDAAAVNVKLDLSTPYCPLWSNNYKAKGGAGTYCHLFSSARWKYVISIVLNLIATLAARHYHQLLASSHCMVIWEHNVPETESIIGRQRRGGSWTLFLCSYSSLYSLSFSPRWTTVDHCFRSNGCLAAAGSGCCRDGWEDIMEYECECVCVCWGMLSSLERHNADGALSNAKARFYHFKRTSFLFKVTYAAWILLTQSVLTGFITSWNCWKDANLKKQQKKKQYNS